MTDPKRVLAMPSLCDSTDFGLSDETKNRELLLKLKKKHPLHLADLDGGLVLYRHGSDADGAYFVASSQGVLAYYMRYTELNKNFVGTNSVTQTAVWQSLSSGLPNGFVLQMVFDILLKKYPAVMSDRIQTDGGRNLWIRLMGRSLVLGYKVKLLDFAAKNSFSIETEENLRQWSSDETGAWAFKSRKHENLRFVIYKKEA